MTALNETLKDKICRYCGNCKGNQCAADVPWYCVSPACRFFREEPLPRVVRRRAVNVRRYLVETF